MCVGAALLGAGKAATAFNIGLGLTAVNAFAGRAAAKDRANQTYNQALLANQSAEADKRQRQLALSERKSEEEKFAAQDKFAKTIDALQAKASIVASEQAGTTVGLLLMDQERQAANYREKINQSLESILFFFSLFDNSESIVTASTSCLNLKSRSYFCSTLAGSKKSNPFGSFVLKTFSPNFITPFISGY